MNKRIKKKIAKRELSNQQCPKCGCKDGIIAHIIKGKIHKQKFVWCLDCEWKVSIGTGE